MGEQTRFQRWESGLIAAPDVIALRELDICLMKQARRKIQRGGYLQFENLMYRGENLAGYAGETVIVRYDPKDITEILVYRQEGSKEVFLARATAQNLETESISIDEAKASSRKVREAGKMISNQSILAEVRDRSLFTPSDQKTRKERQKEEQAELPTQKRANKTEAVNDLEEEATATTSETPQVEVLDYEELLDDYGF